ncbi:related to RNA polymerase II mediator complex protein pmc1 [Ustilago sp. UG-2017a]|nr:related to RNA polymerase II mediator complex protein pmc1 [Ustilago sp. UG-2017a]
MPSTPHGANGISYNHHVTQSSQPNPSSRSATANNTSMTSNGNVMHASSPSGALSAQQSLGKDKHLLTSPHKLNIGVPPATTPKTHQGLNGSTNGQEGHQHLAPHHNGAANGTLTTDAKGKQRQVDPIENIPLVQLEQELPLEETDLVSLAALVERLANYGYESLQNLAETLPSLPSSSKRAKIFNTALDVRKQFIKLLVLSRWSKDVTDLQKARNIIALLSEQQWQHEDVFAGLTDIRKILPNARMRNADLPTAIDVLQTGTYRRLPSSIKDMAVAPKPFTDEQALAIVARLEDALRTRMACREYIPAPLSDYSIRDGQVHFRVQGLFEAALTASSGGRDEEADSHVQSAMSGADEAATTGDASAEDRWWLLDLSFDVTPTGSSAASSSRMFPKKPKKAYRERLRIWGDQELAPRPQVQSSDEAKTEQTDVAPQQADVAEEPKGAEEDQDKVQNSDPTVASTEAAQDGQTDTKESKERDASLLRLFAFLQERSLHYQMDILQHQAYALCRLNWGSNLRIETGERPRRLTVHYWTQAQGATGAAQKVDSPAAGGSVQIIIVDLPDHAGAAKTLATLFDDDEHQTDQARAVKPTTVKRRGLQVTWDAHSSILADSTTSDLSISPHSLDIEALLSLVIKRHTAALLRNLQRRILVSDHPLSRLLRPEDCTLCVEDAQRQGDEFSTATEMTETSFLQIELRGSDRQRAGRAKQGSMSAMPPLRLSVDPVTGRILLDSEPARVSTDIAVRAGPQQSASFTASILSTRPTFARLAEASDRINGSIDALFNVLYKLEVFARVEEWERMASYLGLRTVRKLNLRPQDLTKFGPSTSPETAPKLFIPLRNSFPGYFLALQPSELAGASIGLVYVVQMMDATGAPSLTVQSIEWLDRTKIASTSKAERGFKNNDLAIAAEIGQKRKATGVQDGTMTDVASSIGTKDLTMEELADVHSYCIALVSYFRVEQQLRMRGIPYLHVGSNTARSAPPAKRQRRIAAPAGAGAQADVRDNGLFKDDEDPSGGTAPGDDGGADASPTHDGHDAGEQATADSRVGTLVPTLCLRATDLLGSAKAHLTKPNISLRVRKWDDTDACCVQVLVKLRMKSRRFRQLHEVVAYATTSDQHSTSPATWIDFDNETALLTLSTRDLDNCIPIFYTQWERIMRMVQLTREVLNASRAWQLRALRSRISCKKPSEIVELRRFDFDVVLFSYGTIKVDDLERKLLVRVRWQDAKMEMAPYTNTPMAQSGGYILEFGSIPTSEIDALDKVTDDADAPSAAGATTTAVQREDAVSQWFHDAHTSANPHNTMAFELRRTVNIAARSAAMSAMVQPQLERLVWKGFFKLLQDTLPLVREIAPLTQKCLTDPEVPEVETKDATWFRLRFQDRYALDLRLATRSRLVASDASQPLFRSESQDASKGLNAAEPTEQSKDGLFSGSDLLNNLVAGKPATTDTNVTRPKAKKRTDLSAAMQFQPIPNMDSVLRKIHTWLRTSEDGEAGQQRVWDLRRALLISLAPLDDDKADGLVGKILPKLVEMVSAEIGAASGE